jgi:hypothetical protein
VGPVSKYAGSRCPGVVSVTFALGDGCPSTADKKGTECDYSVPLSMYSAPGGLRQDPGRAAKLLAEARTQ